MNSKRYISISDARRFIKASSSQMKELSKSGAIQKVENLAVGIRSLKEHYDFMSVIKYAAKQNTVNVATYCFGHSAEDALQSLMSMDDSLKALGLSWLYSYVDYDASELRGLYHLFDAINDKSTKLCLILTNVDLQTCLDEEVFKKLMVAASEKNVMIMTMKELMEMM